MNFSWTAFTLSCNGAVGTPGSNIARITAVVLAIGLVLIYKWNKHLPYILNFKTLWFSDRKSEKPLVA